MKLGLRTPIAAAAGLLTAIGTVTALRAAVQANVYQPPTAAPLEPPTGFTTLRSSDGQPIVFRSAPEGRPTVMYFHGNGGDVSRAQHILHDIAALGYGVAAPEYPGYGELQNVQPTAQGLRESTCAAIDVIADRDDVAEIWLLGHSLGSAFAIHAAATGRGHKVLIVAGFTSITDVVSGYLGGLPAGFLVGDNQLNSLALAPQVYQPAVVLHGTKDKVVGYRLGERLHHELPNSELMTAVGIGHETIHESIPAALTRLAER